mmetsp:Transcript_116817/g.337507  ORF Transcript_116817/g.337507 Transcript_116817/m.337507 type:complete len:324 (+) Transcript_116817:393-1364(+)
MAAPVPPAMSASAGWWTRSTARPQQRESPLLLWATSVCGHGSDAMEKTCGPSRAVDCLASASASASAAAALALAAMLRARRSSSSAVASRSRKAPNSSRSSWSPPSSLSATSSNSSCNDNADNKLPPLGACSPSCSGRNTVVLRRSSRAVLPTTSFSNASICMAIACSAFANASLRLLLSSRAASCAAFAWATRARSSLSSLLSLASSAWNSSKRSLYSSSNLSWVRFSMSVASPRAVLHRLTFGGSLADLTRLKTPQTLSEELWHLLTGLYESHPSMATSCGISPWHFCSSNCNLATFFRNKSRSSSMSPWSCRNRSNVVVL